MKRCDFLLIYSILFIPCFLNFSCCTEKYMDRMITIETEEKDPEPEIHETIELVSWNIGYACLGENADFIADGGKSLFPSNNKTISNNYTSIIKLLNEINPDIIFFEEIGAQSSLTGSINLFDSIRTGLPLYKYLYFVPKYTHYLCVMNLNIGNSIFSKIRFSEVSTLELGKVKQHPLGPEEFHHFLKARITITPDKELVLYLVHLPAFDKNAKIRFKHLDTLKEDMLLEYDAGHYILCAGDWNLRLILTDFTSTTREKYLTWLFDLPETFTPPGWKWHIDSSTPTVRTLERPYNEGENYTTIIDGILTSPGIIVHANKTFDLGFENSDHNPVYIKFSLE